jgi:hypothetical protein
MAIFVQDLGYLIVGGQRKQSQSMRTCVTIDVLWVLQRIYKHFFLFHGSLRDSEWYILPKTEWNNKTINLHQVE